MCILKNKISFLLLAVVLICMIVVVVSCTSSLTNDNTSESEYKQYGDSRDKIDELWVISSQILDKSKLTIDDVRRIVEKNKECYVVDGKIDVELLKSFIAKQFGDVDVITNPDDIAKILSKVYICCVYDPETDTLIIKIIVR